MDSMNQTFAVPHDETFEDSLFVTGDSTRSLLTPLYASDYVSDGTLMQPEDTTFGVDELNVTVESCEKHDEVNNKSDDKVDQDFNEPEDVASRDESEQSKGSPENETSQSPSSVTTKRLVSVKQKDSKTSSEKSSKTSSKRASSKGNTSGHASSSDSSSSSSTSSSSSSSSNNSSSSSPTKSKSPCENRKDKATYHSFYNTKLSWDEWMISKSIKRMSSLQLEQEALIRKQLDEQKRKAEQQTRLELAKEQREQWLNEKMFLKKKKKQEEQAQLEFERLKKKQEADLVQSRSKERYDEWLNKVHASEKQKRIQIKKNKQEQMNNMIMKQNQRDEAYKLWLKNSKNKSKKRPVTYGYSDGKLLSFYDMGASPTPQYTNHIPWVSSSTSEQKNNRDDLDRFSSPPLMWRDVEARHKSKRNTPRKVI